MKASMQLMKARALLLTGILSAVAMLGAACTSDDESTSVEPTSTAPLLRTPESNAPVLLDLTDVVADVADPMDVHSTGGSLLVAERSGVVKELLPDGSGGYDLAGTVVELTDDVGSTEAEKGLLGITTDPSGDHLYLNHTRAEDGATVVLELALSGDPGALRATEPRELLQIDQPFPNHNGGDLAWGPDGMLWIGTGDGGAGGDPDGRAQRLDTPLGKILRLDPSLQGQGSDLAPADNPYANGTDDAGNPADPLIWARGLRNPWRITFDTETGDLWVADVGQDRIEEVSVLRAAEGTGRAADLGWDRFEGDEPFDDPGPTDGWPDDDAPLIEPVHAYDHDGRCSISGGFVYRGLSIPELDGGYLFSDFCDGQLWFLDPDGTAVVLGVSGDAIVSINADENGEPLVLDANGLKRLLPADSGG